MAENDQMKAVKMNQSSKVVGCKTQGKKKASMEIMGTAKLGDTFCGFVTFW